MKSKIVTQVAVNLYLTKEEAMAVREYLRNPLIHTASPKDELDDARELRHALYTAISEPLEALEKK